MVPDTDLQFQVVLKALADVVAPAVDPANKVAVEQLHLSIATLKLMRAQLPMLRRFTRALLGDGIRMAEAVMAEVSSHPALSHAIAGAKQALSDPAVEADTIESARQKLTNQIVSIVENAQETQKQRFETMIVALSAAPIERFRAWFIGSGFEPHGEEIPKISDLLG